ncbi:serine hydrolase domain-containing protein [Noviherbaspirillum sp. 1P10PC]|uniref:serine hydrolase domain-containing protein n=1 Tax=Noviherbaspirillum sp. 1P10PC TaxID=3132292 RepID=UPI00399F0A9B
MHTGCKRLSFIAGAALLTAIISLPAHAAPAVPSAQTVKRQVEPAIKGLMKQYGIPGASVAVAYQGKIVYQGGFGLSDVAAGEKVTAQTRFRIASVSKALTAVTVLRLFEPSLPAALDRKVFGPQGLLPDAAFPEYAKPKDARVLDITLRDLLQHTSGWGIDGYDPQFDLVNVAREMGVAAPASPRTIIAYMLRHHDLGAAPGTQAMYSNFGYNILGRIIEHKTGKPYVQAVKDTVLRRAGAEAMFIPAASGAIRMPHETVYYDYPNAELSSSVNGSGRKGPASYVGLDFNSMDAHGGWAGTPTDLVRFALALRGKDGKPGLLSQQTMKLLSQRSPRFPDSQYGLAFNVLDEHGVRILERPGALVGGTYAIVQMRDDGWTWALALNRMPISDPVNLSMDKIAIDLTKARDDVSKAVDAIARFGKPGAAMALR